MTTNRDAGHNNKAATKTNQTHSNHQGTTGASHVKQSTRTRSKQSAKAPRWVRLRASMTLATPHKIWRVATWKQVETTERGGGREDGISKLRGTMFKVKRSVYQQPKPELGGYLERAHV